MKRKSKKRAVKKPRVSYKMKYETVSRSVRQLSEVYANANTEIDELKDKVCAYMESASLYKAENEDLRAKCKELDRLLMDKGKQLETANTELERALNDKKIYFEAANTLKRLNDDLKASNKYNETSKNTYRELYEKEKQKSLWQKLKEGFSRG